jgi:hypothetical protein
MKKCSFCGEENPDEATQCRQCQTPLDTPAGGSPRPVPVRRVLPYFLSYILVASGVFLFDYIRGQQSRVPFPPHFLILNTSLSPDEVAAKLVQAGVPKDDLLGALAPRPDAGRALLHHFALFAVVLFAFWALTNLFKRFFKK